MGCKHIEKKSGKSRRILHFGTPLALAPWSKLRHFSGATKSEGEIPSVTVAPYLLPCEQKKAPVGIISPDVTMIHHKLAGYSHVIRGYLRY